jgi:hypothetical protein
MRGNLKEVRIQETEFRINLDLSSNFILNSSLKLNLVIFNERGFFTTPYGCGPTRDFSCWRVRKPAPRFLLIKLRPPQ